MAVKNSPPARFSEQNYRNHDKWHGYESARANFFAGQPNINVDDMAQCGRRHHRGEQNREEIP